ncbi:MAG: DNA polymerase III subunit alpha [Anaerolineae bacterium]|nr:DNA polymerase III subunit alpha [Anaerolineae bacterium]
MTHFTHLHVHSHYTLLGALPAVDALAERAAHDGLTHLALTDTNVLYGAIALDRACRAVNICPILGMVVTVAWPADLNFPGDNTVPGLLVLLAQGPVGYRSLCRLSSLIQGRADREMLARRGVSLEDLRAHREGLTCIGGGRRGWVERVIRAGDPRNAQRYVGRLAGIYEQDIYLSLELHTPEDVAVAREVLAIGDFLGVPAVAVQPVYVLSPEDAPRLRLLAAMNHNCLLDAVSASSLPDGGNPCVGVHWLSPTEMEARFIDFPEALTRVGDIIRRCDPALPTGSHLWPALDLPAGETPETALAEWAMAGLRERYGAEEQENGGVEEQRIQGRLRHELSAINRYGYAPFFLIVADIVRFARKHDIPVSTRGSVANSLVAYCVGITTVDPIAHNLLFERFLSPEREDVPDIDLDLCSRRRDEVLAYVRHKYGADRVALVATVSTLQARSAVRETAKAYGVEDARLKPLLDHLPHGWHPRRRDDRALDEILAPVDDPHLREVARLAYSLVGQPHHLSVHPGGVVITPGPLTDFLPVQWAPKGFLITQFDHQDVEVVGLPKIDLLGIRALTVLADAAALVRRDADPAFRLTDIPLDDAVTGDLLARGETVGVFQCESEGARRTLCQLRARTVRDLVGANAFFKPGPATGGMARAFVQRYRGEAPVTYLHPALEPILSSTQGVLLFQEQILRVATEIAGLSWREAGHLRRGMSKMDPVEMARMQVSFVTGCQRPPPEGAGFTPEQAEQLWQQVQVFAGYGFNQGHATAYADVSYRSAYLKAHWPAAFCCARLKDWGGYHHPAVYMAEAIRLGIDVRPPHVNYSEDSVTLAWEGSQAVLWLGLSLVRDLRQQTIAALVAARKQGPFAGLRDLLVRIPVQEKELTHLIQVGALDDLGENRTALLAEAASLWRAGNAQQLAFDFIHGDVAPETPMQCLEWEKHGLGYPFHALQMVLSQLLTQIPLAASMPGVVPLRRLPELPGRRVSLIGVRLPGWGGGRGFNLWDGDTWELVKLPQGQHIPASWMPVCVQGHWVQDAWGRGWMQAESISILDIHSLEFE